MQQNLIENPYRKLVIIIIKRYQNKKFKEEVMISNGHKKQFLKVAGSLESINW